MQTIHIYSGLPWWALIPFTTVSLRLLWTLPLAIMQRKRVQKQSELRPIINAMGPILRLKLAAKAQSSKARELNAIDGGVKSQAASLTYEQIMLLSAKERRSRQKQLFRENNCQVYKNFFLPALQVPLWVAMSATFRDLSGWNDLSGQKLDTTLTNEGLWWFSDLTVADPLSIMPIVLGFLALTNIEWNFKTFQLQNTSIKRSKRITAFDSMINISRLSTTFLMAIATQAPAALALYWISSNAFSTIQNIFLDYYLPIKYTPQDRKGEVLANDHAKPLYE
ncbi:hypothetical protein WICMUC_000305 [Wickerhamomyces mucosus]|uniref:Membrane insertase YidC/Oxa/ALB C-terminal domain-containing protein n=1 Tax=Wickerhamomyces mucosus TaxID=1378264 RepID=A0A9P8TJ18_9ASCO|nr:hypothetical protein WICMUC_000305 [Wickerhamomyces mucosus]